MQDKKLKMIFHPQSRTNLNDYIELKKSFSSDSFHNEYIGASLSLTYGFLFFCRTSTEKYYI